jgi:hypothetical protein
LQMLKDVAVGGLVVLVALLATASWLIRQIVTGAPVDFSRQDVPWFFAHGLCFLLPFLFAASLKVALTIKRHAAGERWTGFSIGGLVQSFSDFFLGFIPGIALMLGVLHLWIARGWDTSWVVLLVLAILALPIGVSCALINRLGTFLKVCACTTLLLILACRGGVKESCSFEGGSVAFDSQACELKAKAFYAEDDARRAQFHEQFEKAEQQLPLEIINPDVVSPDAATPASQ